MADQAPTTPGALDPRGVVQTAVQADHRSPFVAALRQFADTPPGGAQ